MCLYVFAAGWLLLLLLLLLVALRAGRLHGSLFSAVFGLQHDDFFKSLVRLAAMDLLSCAVGATLAMEKDRLGAHTRAGACAYTTCTMVAVAGAKCCRCLAVSTLKWGVAQRGNAQSSGGLCPRVSRACSRMCAG